MKKILPILLLTFSAICGEYVDIISNFYLNNFPAKFLNFKEDYEVRFTKKGSNYLKTYDPYDQDVKKIIIFNDAISTNDLEKYPKEKLLLFQFEPFELAPAYYKNCSRIYTWDDTKINNQNVFRFNYPFLQPMKENPTPFKERKFSVMIASHWVKHRITLVRYFQNKHPSDLDVFGWKSPPFKTPLYKGQINGYHSGDPKIRKLQEYRFCFCFENSIDLQGYISEKIFDCFAAGCVPVYLGAPNIEQYIPKGCYIDPCNFSDLEDLYQFLKSMPEESYEEYIKNIQTFIKSDQGRQFTPDDFEERLYHATLEL